MNTSEKRPEAPVKLAPLMKWLISRIGCVLLGLNRKIE